jgi:putative endonuclease
MFYVYLLQSLKNQKIYVGFTSKNPKNRTKEHNKGSNKFTRDNGPWRLVYYETFSCKQCAKNREKFFKSGVGKRLKKIIIENI